MKSKPPTTGPCPFCDQYPCECSNWDDEACEQPPKKPKEATAVKEQPKNKRKRKEQG